MKKLLLSFILLTLSLSASAMSPDSLRTTIICEEGYKFIVAYSTTSGTGPSIVQIMKNGTSSNRPPQPMMCNKKQSK